ncbi:hypothetical protein ACI65C_004421 [Semiaphis heraclei]
MIEKTTLVLGKYKHNNKSNQQNIQKQTREKNALLNELNVSILTKHSNLTKEFILNYSKFQNKKPTIITWNGNTDKEILKRLGINITILNITSYDLFNDGNFYLQIINTVNNKTLLQKYIGKIRKIVFVNLISYYLVLVHFPCLQYIDLLCGKLHTVYDGVTP